MTHTPPATPPALIGVLRAISDGAAGTLTGGWHLYRWTMVDALDDIGELLFCGGWAGLGLPYDEPSDDIRGSTR
jgi:hypothetical protein